MNTKATIIEPDGSTYSFDYPAPLDVCMSSVDPHDMMRYIDEDTGMMPRTAPCFHNITRGPLHDSEVREVCRLALDRIEVEELYTEIKTWGPAFNP